MSNRLFLSGIDIAYIIKKGGVKLRRKTPEKGCFRSFLHAIFAKFFYGGRGPLCALDQPPDPLSRFVELRPQTHKNNGSVCMIRELTPYNF